jgi:hypothetical protein
LDFSPLCFLYVRNDECQVVFKRFTFQLSSRPQRQGAQKVLGKSLGTEVAPSLHELDETFFAKERSVWIGRFHDAIGIQKDAVAGLDVDFFCLHTWHPEHDP